MINLGILNEVRTPFFSIPKLADFRGQELSVTHFIDSFRALKDLVVFQHGGESHVTSGRVGAYYLFTIPFTLAGVVLHVISFVRSYKNGNNDLQYVFLIWLISAILMSVLNEYITVIHINMLHIPVIFYGVYGLVKITEYLENKYILPLCLIFWSISFVLFLQNYVATQSESSYFIGKKADEVLERAKELSEEDDIITIFDTTIIKYSYLLWYEKPAISDYYQNVVYDGPPGWAEMVAYGSYRYLRNLEDVTVDGIYIISDNREEAFRDLGFEIEKVNDEYYIAAEPFRFID